MLSNNESPSHIIAYGLAAIALGKDVELPYRHHRVQVDTTLYKNYVGHYDAIQILSVDGKLYYYDMEMELIPESSTKFFRSDDNDRTIEFVLNKAGVCDALILTKGGVREIHKKQHDPMSL